MTPTCIIQDGTFRSSLFWAWMFVIVLDHSSFSLSFILCSSVSLVSSFPITGLGGVVCVPCKFTPVTSLHYFTDKCFHLCHDCSLGCSPITSCSPPRSCRPPGMVRIWTSPFPFLPIVLGFLTPIFSSDGLFSPPGVVSLCWWRLVVRLSFPQSLSLLDYTIWRNRKGSWEISS